MDVYKLIGVGIIGAFAFLTLKNAKSEASVFVLIATGVVMLIYVLSGLTDVVETFSTIVNKTGLDNGLFAGVLKVIGIGYITEYSAGVCNDLGAGSISSKILLGGKVAIFILALPILNKLVEIVVSLMP